MPASQPMTAARSQKLAKRAQPRRTAKFSGLEKSAVGVPEPVGLPVNLGVLGTGEQAATFVVIPLPRDQAQALLPPELRLERCDVAGADQHPLICAFGLQRNVRTAFPFSHSVQPK